MRSIVVFRRSVAAARFSKRSGSCAANCADAGGTRMALLATACAVSRADSAADRMSLGRGTFGGVTSVTLPHRYPRCQDFPNFAACLSVLGYTTVDYTAY